MKTLSTILLILVTATAFAQNKTVRDSSNNIVEIWREQGGATTVWSRDNEQLYTRYRQGDRVIIRTPDNEEIGEEDYDD